MLARAVAKKRMENTMVDWNKTLSTPRLVVYTVFEPPKAAPRPEPFCCNKTTKIRSTAKMICKIDIDEASIVSLLQIKEFL